MKIEEYQKQLEDMTEEEINELILDIRRNRNTSMTTSRVAAVKKKTKEKNVKSAASSLSAEEKAELREMLLAMKEEDQKEGGE